MTTLILVRHGESETNRSKVFTGQIDPELQESGLKQAQLTARYIAENYKVDKIYASDLKRAYNTAKCLADLLNSDVVKNKNLREIYAGKWEGVKFSELESLYPDEYSLWLTDIGNSKSVGGESVKELSDRVLKELTKLCIDNAGKTIAVFTHATPIRTFQCMLQKGNLDEMKNIPWVSNASVSVFEYIDGEWNVLSISKDEHLGELKTSLPVNV